jgi:hypothetical protein
MQTLRNVNKKLEAKVSQGWQHLRKDELVRELEGRTIAAESRVAELEENLASFIDDFELLNQDLTECA